MTLAEYSMMAFALLNGGRAVAYFPQMVRVYRDPNGAAAVSLVTWNLFAAANVATVCYALTVSYDLIVASVFAVNAAGCLMIAGLTALKRMRTSSSAALLRGRIASLRQSPMRPPERAPSLRAPDYSPSAVHRDAMIRQGLMS
jgi:hypothetical protein